MAVNKRVSVLALTILATVLATALIAALTFGGGAGRTVASRSAAAFREAQRKGEPVGEGAHGHGAVSPGVKAQPAHAEHGASEMRKPERVEERKGYPQEAAGGHAGMQHGSSAAPAAGRPAGGHAGMQHGGAAAAGTPRGPMAGGPAVPSPGPRAIQASPGQPAATLRPDPLDHPPETSVEEAKRAEEMAQGMGDGHGMQHGMTSYRQLDAGRDSGTTGSDEGRVATPPPTTSSHGSMQHGSPRPAASKPPVVRKPPPSKPKPGAPPPQPTHPPHHSGGGERTQ